MAPSQTQASLAGPSGPRLGDATARRALTAAEGRVRGLASSLEHGRRPGWGSRVTSPRSLGARGTKAKNERVTSIFLRPVDYVAAWRHFGATHSLHGA